MPETTQLLIFAQALPPLGPEGGDYTKLGVIAALLGLIVWMIKYFVSAIERTQASQATSMQGISVAVTAMGDRLATSDANLANAIQDLRVATIQQAASNFSLREIMLVQTPGASLTTDQVEQVANRVAARLKE